ncbi:MAG: tetratricopeptide repeat protein [Armatimonadota bacterium]
MKKYLILLITLIFSMPVVSKAQSQPDSAKRPMVLVFTGVIMNADNTSDNTKSKKKKSNKKEEKPTVTAEPEQEAKKPIQYNGDPRVAIEVMSQLAATGKVDVLPFNPDHAAIQRAIIEKRMKQEVIDNLTDEGNLIQIAKVIGADYALRIQGSTNGKKVDVALEMIRIQKSAKWISAAASDIEEATGPRTEVNRKNAIFNAVGSALSQIMILTFGQKEMANSSSVTDSAPTIIEIPVTARNIQDEISIFVKQADVLIAQKNIPGAIYELRRAINLQPNKSDIRSKLISLYLEIGKTNEAIDECRRALLYNKSDLTIYNQLTKLYIASGDLSKASDYANEVVRSDPNNIDARLNLGDLYWNQSKVDDAEKAYLDAVNAAPTNPAPHLKLNKLYMAKKKYQPAIEHLLQSKLLSSGQTDENARYAIVAQISQEEYKTVTEKLDSSKTDFEKNVITREDYYQECKSVVDEVDALIDILSNEKIPAKYITAHAHIILSTSLLSQASGSLVSYFETEKSHYLDQADVLQTEAQNEMDIFIKAINIP